MVYKTLEIARVYFKNSLLLIKILVHLGKMLQSHFEMKDQPCISDSWGIHKGREIILCLLPMWACLLSCLYNVLAMTLLSKTILCLLPIKSSVGTVKKCVYSCRLRNKELTGLLTQKHLGKRGRKSQPAV